MEPSTNLLIALKYFRCCVRNLEKICLHEVWVPTAFILAFKTVEVMTRKPVWKSYVNFK